MKREEIIDYIVDFINSWNPSGKKCLVVYGHLGVGKTYIIREACNRSNSKLEIIDSDITELGDKNKVIDYVTTSGLFNAKKVVLLDRPHEFLSFQMIKQIIIKARVPVIIEIDTESRKYYSHLMCAEVWIPPLPKSEIVKLVKHNMIKGIKPNFKAISNDVRQSLLTVYGSQGYSNQSWIDVIEHFFKTGEAKDLEYTHIPVIIDTGIRSYQGLKIIEFFKLLIPADLHKDPSILDGLKPNKPTINISYYFYERVKALKESETGK